MRVFLIVLFLYTSCCVYLLDGKAMTADSKAILAIKQILLRSLDLAAPPPITNGLPSKAAIQHSIRIWENNTVEEAKYVEKATITLTAMNTRGINSFTFNFNEDEFLEKNYTISSVNLRFSPSKKLSSVNKIKILSSKKKKPIPIVPALNDHSLRVDILSDIQRWINKAGNNGLYTIKINCGMADFEPCTNSAVKPFIEIVYKKLRRTRYRKALACSNGKNGCCRQTIHVTVKELGWSDWFFGPLEFDYHYCTGSCANQKATFYSQLFGGLNSASSCCVPTELTGLRALYLSGDTIKDKYLHNVMAVDCACGGGS